MAVDAMLVFGAHAYPANLRRLAFPVKQSAVKSLAVFEHLGAVTSQGWTYGTDPFAPMVSDDEAITASSLLSGAARRPKARNLQRALTEPRPVSHSYDRHQPRRPLRDFWAHLGNRARDRTVGFAMAHPLRHGSGAG